MANYSLGKISKQPFPPTIFYDTLKAIIYTFHSTFLSEMVTVWKVATSIIKMILSAGCVQSNKKCVLLAKQNKIGSIYKNYSLVLSRVGKAPGYLYWDHGGSFCTDIKIFQIFLKKKYMLFSFEVCIPKTVSHRPKHARKMS